MRALSELASAAGRWLYDSIAVSWNAIERSDFRPECGGWNGLLAIVAWFVPSAAIIALTRFLPDGPQKDYLQAAMCEGTSLFLWNILAVFGLMILGVLFVFPRSGILALFTRNTLLAAFSVGALSFGLLGGQLLLLSATEYVNSWHDYWFKLLQVWPLFIIALAMIIGFWWSAALVDCSGGVSRFIQRLRDTHALLRMLAGSILFAVPLLVFILFDFNVDALQSMPCVFQ